MQGLAGLCIGIDWQISFSSSQVITHVSRRLLCTCSVYVVLLLSLMHQKPILCLLPSASISTAVQSEFVADAGYQKRAFHTSQALKAA